MHNIMTLPWQCNIVIYGEADTTARRQQNMRPLSLFT